ncbi:type VI secretion system membrane subunit TssM [Ralstonia sp.]|uniref:type VI secretion system membrane subunit TssM n=1 Tax=Ralstonia sp. TaxID=54061 RepID=UPI002C009AF2|nr:type VI secretion system membrane subunit TssM [Ralstonia sp.]HWV05564.1 type VI secretion system membrane subunit TssM [Ralstonia sp.]
MAAIALCLLIWHAGPLLALSGHHPLQEAPPRLLLVVAIVVVSVIYLFSLLWRNIRSGGMVRQWMDVKTEDEEGAAPESNVKAVTSSVDTAMRQLKALRTHNGLGRLLEGKRYLYELPWYLTLGFSEAGKTSMLTNAGLRFPLAGGARSAASVEGDCKTPAWRFTNEAVLIDPVGNSTSQTHKPEAAKAEWSRFLDLLRKYRGRAPINGAVVTISVADLVKQPSQERADAAFKIRNRLAELRQELGIEFPIYVVVTKVDLLPGFAQYFQYLGIEGRAQSWGFGLPPVEKSKRNQPALAIAELYVKNEELIRSARDFLDGNTSTERLYDRAKAAMMEAAPQDFTLVRAIGPQAGTVFSRASGEPLERGIPGLFTYDGYHKLFNARLPGFVSQAQAIDAWVMGRAGAGVSAQKKTLESAAGKLTGDDPLTWEIRRLYLTEYAQRWTEFLSDIRALTGNNLAFDLEILRNFAAPDSPLARLGRVVVRETTLSQGVESEDKSLADRALAVLDKKSDKISGFAARAEGRQERELVDNRFAALREVVTGHADMVAPNAKDKGGQPRLDAIASMVNAYYTSLMVASNALETRNLPPPVEAGAQLKMEAAKLPAPLKEVLADLVVQGTRDVNKGIGDILIAQMNAVVGESCRSAIDGKYPFTPTSAQDVDAEDFARVFASGGVLDDFFQKVLAPHVDATISPWRYKLNAPDVPPVAGPSLIPFQRAKEIREVFFRDPGAKKMAWKIDLKVVELDPEIVELTMDFDGQSMRYVHGPVIPLKVTWPGPRAGQGAEITANPRVRPETSTLTANGPWAMMRVIAKGKLANSVSPSNFVAEYDFDGRKAKLDINTGSLANPWTTRLLQGFQCPGRSG